MTLPEVAIIFSCIMQACFRLVLYVCIVYTRATKHLGTHRFCSNACLMVLNRPNLEAPGKHILSVSASTDSLVNHNNFAPKLAAAAAADALPPKPEAAAEPEEDPG